MTEREQFEAWARRQGLHNDRGTDKYMYGDTQAAWEAWQASRAEPERKVEPVAWQFYENGKWRNGDDKIKDHRKNTEAAGIPTRDLYPPQEQK